MKQHDDFDKDINEEFNKNIVAVDYDTRKRLIQPTIFIIKEDNSIPLEILKDLQPKGGE